MNHRTQLTIRTVAFLLSVAVLLLTTHPTGLAVIAASSGASSTSGDKAANAKATDTESSPAEPTGINNDEGHWLYDDGDSDDDEDGDGEDEEEFYDGDDDEEFDDEYDEEYELKIEQAMTHHASKSQRLLQRALREGGAAKAVEISPDGNVVPSSGNSGSLEDELWQVEFAHAALVRELDKLLDIRASQLDNDDSGDDDDFDHYAQLKKEKEEFIKNDPELKKLLDGIDDEQYRDEAYMDIKEEWDDKNNLNPDLWHRFKYWELHAFFSCARVFAGGRPVYDDAKWNEIRDFWYEFVEEDKKEKPIREGESERSYQYVTETFDPPLEPFQTKGKGRGLKAMRDISKGEMIFKATNNTVIFTHGHTWRKFLFAINERHGVDKPLDDSTTCDVLVWSWVQTLVEDGPLVIVADFDNGSLLNEGRDEPGWELPNVRCGKEGDKMCHLEYYATKDIKEGDELLCDYREFAMLDSWPSMGL